MISAFRLLPGLAVLTACVTPAPAPTAEAIDWAPVPAFGNVPECSSAGAEGRAACLVRRPWTADQLRRIVRDKDGVLRTGNELTFAYEGPAESVLMQGGLATPLSRLRGTDLWFATVRIPEIERAIVSYFFFPRGAGAVRKRAVRQWRGSKAPPAVEAVETLAGRMTDETVASRFLPAPRKVTVYSPPERNGEPIRNILYMADGEALSTHMPVIEALILAGRIPRTLVVAPHSAPPGQYGDKEDSRVLEYNLGAAEQAGMPRDAFTGHERFFIEELIPWAENRYGAPRGPRGRFVGGFSNGGVFAIQMALRHPGTFAYVFAISPAGSAGLVDPGIDLRSGTRFYLSGGRFEPSFHAGVLKWAELFRKNGTAYLLREPFAGHDPGFWKDALAEALIWAKASETGG